MADEPTTDLDREGLVLLRKKLSTFPGAVLLVSHDRALLRAICTRIWYLEDGKISDFPGNYDDFMKERLRRRERAAFSSDGGTRRRVECSQMTTSTTTTASSSAP